MESQDSLIHSITNADEGDLLDDSVESTTPPVNKPRLLILEPAVLLLFFAWSVTGKNCVVYFTKMTATNFPQFHRSGTVFQNQIIYQTCTEIFKFNKSECILLGTRNGTNETEIIEKLVQPYAAKFFMARTIVESILPALASLFIGPWSDKYGRKPVIVSTFVGECF